MNVILHFGPYYRNRNTMKRTHEITMRGTMETITNHDKNSEVLVDDFGNVFFFSKSYGKKRLSTFDRF